MKNCFASLAVALLLAAPVLTRAQGVGVGTAAPHASAALDVTSTKAGVLVPRLTAAQRQAIANPTTGLLVFQADGSPQVGFWFNAGPPDVPAWTFINPVGAGDNLGNHTATQALNLRGFALTGTGADVGTAVGLGVRADAGLNLGQNTAGNNVFLGYQAGQANTTGTANQFSGNGSGFFNTTGSNNTALGSFSGPAPGSEALTNTTALGANAAVSQSNSLVLGGTGTNALNLGIGLGNRYSYGGGFLGGSSSVSPALSLSYERGVAALGPGVLGVGGFVGYQGASYDLGGGDKWKHSDLIVTVRGAFHYPVSDKFDAYGGLGLGVRRLGVGFEGNGLGGLGTGSSTDLVTTLFVGGRYFFSPGLGAFAEAGYDQTFLKLGLTAKF